MSIKNQRRAKDMALIYYEVKVEEIVTTDKSINTQHCHTLSYISVTLH